MPCIRTNCSCTLCYRCTGFRSCNLFVLRFVLSAIDNFDIVEPLPENIYPIEFTSAEVTCAASDSSGEKTPEKILFMRKDQFATYTEITANDNLYFTNRTEMIFTGEGPGGYLPLKTENSKPLNDRCEVHMLL